MTTTAPGSKRWLFGSTLDLLLGCGVGYLAVAALCAAVGHGTVSRFLPAGLLVMLLALPHYGATLLRVYESAGDRRKYTYFGVHATAALGLLLVAGLQNALIGSMMLTIYLTWSPWHYIASNYGVFLMLVGRRGVDVTPVAKRFVYASFALSYALAFVAIHGVERSTAYAPISYNGTVYHLLPLGIPDTISAVLLPLCAIAYLLTTFISLDLLRRRGSLSDLGPAIVLMVTNAVWFVIPVTMRFSGLAGPDSALASVYTAYGFVLVAGAHSVQYLWVTTYYARVAVPSLNIAGYLGKTALAGFAIWTLPALVFAPGVLGRLPYESGLALLVASFVNLHHFVLDGAIWKLRDGPISQVLMRGVTATDEVAASPITPGAGRRWLPRVVWAGGALSIAVALLGFWEGDFGYRAALARGDLVRVRQAAQRLTWIGRDGPSIHRDIGRQFAKQGELKPARAALERSLTAQPTLATWMLLGAVEESADDWKAAASAFDSALALEPDSAGAHYRSGRMWIQLGDTARARERLERAAELAPNRRDIQLALEQAIRSSEASDASP